MFQRKEGRKEGRKDGWRAHGSPHTSPNAQPGTRGTSAPNPWISGKRGMFGCCPLSHKVLPFPAAPNFPLTPSAPPKTAASPPKHTDTHTLLRILGSGEPLAPHPWPGVPLCFPAPSPAFPTSTELCFPPFPTLHKPLLHIRLVFPKFGSFPSPRISPSSSGVGGTAMLLSPLDCIRVDSAVLLLGKVVVVVVGG